MSKIEGFEYLPVLGACDVDTICNGFDEELLVQLYKDYVNYRLPKSYSKMGLAVKVKEMADMLIQATVRMEGMGIFEMEDVDALALEARSASTLFQRYDRETLKAMYLFVYGHKPLSKDGAMEYAHAILRHAQSMDRARVLLKDVEL